MENNLPDSWRPALLEDLIVFALGGDWGKAPDFDDPQYTDVRCIRASEIRAWDVDKGVTAALRRIKHTSLENRRLRENDIIVEISGGGPDQPVGRTVLIDKPSLACNPETPKICTNFFRLIRPATEINSIYLNVYLQYFYRSGKIAAYQAGSNNLRNLKFNDYLTISVPIAPIEEQHRIIAKIEKLFSELDKGIESLKTAREQLKVYRQAVLKHAFEGKLTAQWREDNKDKLETADQLLARIQKEREAHYQRRLEEWKEAIKKWEAKGKPGKKPSKPRALKTLHTIADDELIELPELPKSWLWEKLGWMTIGVEYGTAAKSTESGSVPVVRMGNIQNAKIDWTDLVFTSDQREISRYSLNGGDVLFNRTNSPELVGKTAIYRGERPALFAGYLIRVNHIQAVMHSQYLNLFLNSHMAKQHGNRVKTDGVNQSNINGDKLSNYPFPYCTMDEQCEVVRILEEKLSIIDQMEEDTSRQLQIAEVLRQSILKKAFSGRLVKQDPNDEPASILLERIKAESPSQLMATSKRKKKSEAA